MSRLPSLPSAASRTSRALAAAIAVLVSTGTLAAVTVSTTVPAVADPAPTPAGVSITTPGPFSGVVPDGVCAVRVTALGGAGGHNMIGGGISTANANGGGADISFTTSVIPGLTFDGVVGGGGLRAPTTGNPGSGGFNGGGAGGVVATGVHPGSGGGGWTELRFDGSTAVIAGGGGGSSGGHSTSEGFGGNAGLPTTDELAIGSPGGAGRDPDGNLVGGGDGGQLNGAGPGGVNSGDAGRNGAAGNLRNGGNGGADADPDSGGGGGGGATGGGGGASTVSNGSGPPIADGIAGGGGGGGSSLINSLTGAGSPQAIVSSVGPRRATAGDGADGAVTLDWIPCDYDLQVDKTVSKRFALVGETVTWEVQVSNFGPDFMNRGDTVTLTDSLPGAGATVITEIFSTDRFRQGPLTCNAAVGDPMPAVLECSRPYVPQCCPSIRGGRAGLAPDEVLRIRYTQVVPGPVGVSYTNTASVVDRVGGDSNDEASATVTTVSVPPTANPDATSGPQGIPQSIDPLVNDTEGDSPLSPGTLVLIDGDGNSTNEIVVSGVGRYDLLDGLIVFTPLPDFVGQATPVRYRITDRNEQTGESTYTPTIDPVSPNADPDGSSGPQGIPQTIDVLANDAAGDPAVPLDPSSLTLLDADGAPTASVVVPGEGSYSVSAGRIVFVPEPGFLGTATPVPYRVADRNGTTAQSTVTPTVTPVTRPDASTGPQGLAQSVDPLANDTRDPAITLDPTTLVLLDPVDQEPRSVVVVPGQGTYTVADGRITFQPLPGFTGAATPIAYRVDDAGSNSFSDVYTPTVTPIGPGANPDTTSGPQGVPQSVDPLLNDRPGDPGVPLDPATLTLLDAAGDPVSTVVVPGQGAYTIADGRIVFTPEPAFVGSATPVRYSVEDRNGTPSTSTYTPVLTGVAPRLVADTTRGPQGRPQSVDPLVNDRPGDPGVPLDPRTLTLLDAAGDPVTSVVLPGQGTYTIAGGRIVFTPLPDFTGTATPVDYRVADANGVVRSSTYTPTLTPVTPSAAPDRTRGPVDTPQSVDPFRNDAPGAPGVPLDRDSLRLLDAEGRVAERVRIPGEGVYTVEGGRIVFTPVPGFTGPATPVGYQIADVNGTTARSTYTPTVETGPALVVTLSDSGPVGSTLVLDPVAEVPGLVPSSVLLVGPDGEEVRVLTVPGEGVWRVDPRTGVVTFTPEDGFTADPTPVEFVGTTKDGTPVTGTLQGSFYRPGPGSPDGDGGSAGPLPATGVGEGLLPLGALGLMSLCFGMFMLARSRRTRSR